MTPHLKKRRTPGPVYDPEGTPYDYMVVIDAGSKGSRMYVYHWPNVEEAVRQKGLAVRLPLEQDRPAEDTADGPSSSAPSTYRSTTPNLEVSSGQGWRRNVKMEVSTRRGWNKSVKPGISQFVTLDRLGPDHLRPLVAAARKIVPPSQHSRTPLFLHATGGVRSLSPTDQEALLLSACEELSRSPFYLPNCSTHVNMIPGDTEGVYGWLSLNQLLGTLPPNHQLRGLLDLGGASAQVAFEPRGTRPATPPDGMMRLQLAPLGSSNIEQGIDLYVNSFEGMGMALGLERHLKTVGNTDPCVPSDTSGNTPGRSLEDPTHGDLERCLGSLFPLIAKGTLSPRCRTGETLSCLLLLAVPELDYSSFIGVSGYWDVAHRLLGGKAKSTYSYAAVYAEASKVCQYTQTDLVAWNQARPTPLSNETLGTLCFKAAWALSVLNNGLGFPQSPEALRVVEMVGKVKYSWTLGRALLYASAESLRTANPLATGAAQSVGFYRYSEPHRFEYGGEAPGHTRPPFALPLATAGSAAELWVITGLHWAGLLGLLLVTGMLLGSHERRAKFKAWTKSVRGHLWTIVTLPCGIQGPYERLGVETPQSLTMDDLRGFDEPGARPIR